MQLRKVVLQSGMHQFPVKVGNMTRASTTGLKNACPHCQSLVGKVNKCNGCAKEIDNSELLKAVQIDDDEIKVFNKEQIEELEGDTVIQIVGKVPKSVIPKTRLMGGFLIRPDIGKGKKASTTAKPWECIRHSLLNSDNVLAVKYTNRGKERPGVITTEFGEMVMLSLAFADDYNLPGDTAPDILVSEQEIEQAKEFVNSLKDVEIDDIRDERKDNIIAQAESGETVTIQAKEKDDGMSFFS